MEMERHRHLSWSVVSQRYVDAATFGVVMPPAIREYCNPVEDPEGNPFGDIFSFINDANDAMKNYQEWVNELSTECGLPRKQAREAARSVLPNATEVRGVVTGNLRAWSTILPLRAHPTADAEMQEVSHLILDALAPVAPTVVDHLRYQISYPDKETA
jgi:thymidylate synthase (FAD)